MTICSGCRMVVVIFGSPHCIAQKCIKKKDDHKMTTAIIKFTATAELNLDSDTFPKGMTKEQKLDYWIAGAKEEPMLALDCLKQVEWEVTGELK